MFHPVRAVHKFDFRLAINWTSNKRRPPENDRGWGVFSASFSRDKGAPPTPSRPNL